MSERAAQFDAPGGWASDDLSAALSAYLASADLLPACWPRAASGDARRFFESAFRFGPPVTAFLTGYYEPELPARLTPDPIYCHPVHAMPDGLPSDQPWATRSEIEERGLLKGRELIWLNSALDAFLAQVQGSFCARLPDGTARRFGYAGKNGHPYRSIGAELIARGAIRTDDMSLAAIRDWAACYPGDLPALLRMNPSYVFFRPLDLPRGSGPLGAMNRPLTPLRSLAVDPAFLPLGAPVWVECEGLPPRLMVAQDTGSAIKGAGRGDIFCGSGAGGETLAGSLRASGRMWPLEPKP